MRIYEDLRTVHWRVGVVQAVVALAVASLVVYFWHLQVIRGKYFRELAENNRLRRVPIRAPRGIIHDRVGRPLAENVPSYNLLLEPEAARDLDDSVAFAAASLAKLLEYT